MKKNNRYNEIEMPRKLNYNQKMRRLEKNNRYKEK